MSETDRAILRVAVHPRVIHESIDGEVIAIDLDTGTYFSLRGSAAQVWELLAGSPGTAAPELIEALASRYGRPTQELAPAIEEFLGELQLEGLVHAVDGEAPSPSSETSLAFNGVGHGAFAPPRLEKYTDMQDLVLLDPVHEVGGKGWPHPQTGPSEQPSRV